MSNENQGFQTSRRQFLAAIAAGALSTTLGCVRLPGIRATSERKPNIVIILADDLGYADISLHGAADIATPNIDSIARNGARFTNGYVTYPACAPSRASLMTGCHHLRLGFPTNPDGVRPTHPGNPLGLLPAETTIAEVLKAQGYRTAAIGKWHLGKEPELHPLSQGFDEFFGFPGSLARYFVIGPAAIQKGRERTPEKEYLTYAFAREATNFIKRNKGNPFFLYLAFNAVHTPLMDDQRPPDNARITLEGSTDPGVNRKIYCRMVESMDKSIGSVLDTLRDMKLEENTIIYFLSDNGGALQTKAYHNEPLRDFKGSVYEGGIRVPFLMQWPRAIAPGLMYNEPVSEMDIFATSAAASGALPSQGGGTSWHRPEIDGVDLIPYLARKKQGAPHDTLLFNFANQYAVRRGPWKLVRRGKLQPELYNLVHDISEKNNVAQENPQIVQDLMERLDTWKKDLPEPLFEIDPQQAKTLRR